MAKVNLDALIPREDFEAVGANNTGNLKHSVSVSDFTNSFFYPFIRKPDFQRETSEWDARKISDFLESYINGDLIPSIILWRSNTGLFFVIDGAHRLSAITAWIFDDYGDGEISRKFYEGNIPDDHKIIAGDARNHINKKIGSYQDIISAPKQSTPNLDYLNRARNLGAFSIQVQWVEGDARKAETSFFKINQQGEPLNNTELKLLKSRKNGNAIAARAIIRAGSGHKYWSNFSAENQNKIQELSEEINQILFTPPLKKTVKSLDQLPIAGRISAAQALPLILDFVNIVNHISGETSHTDREDPNGEDTILYLSKARKIAWRMNSIHASSLGLHPIVYFYSADGRHKTASFYAIAAWILDTENKKAFREFINVREDFEQLLLKYDYLIQEVNRKYRQAITSYLHIKDFYIECIKELSSGKSIDESILEITANQKFSYLKLDSMRDEVTSANFSSERKSAVYIREALKNAVRCSICNGLIGQSSITIDHTLRKQDAMVSCFFL